MKNNDFDFIKNRFNSAAADVPDSLDERVIKYKILTNHKHKTITFKPKKKNNYKAVISAAACFILILGIVFAAVPGFLNSDKVTTFNNYNNLNTKIAELEKAVLPTGGQGGVFKTVLCKQEDGIETPKAVKTDGEYIYCAYFDSNDNINRNKVYIYKYLTESDGAELVSIIDRLAPDATGEYDDIYEINNLFIYKNRLVINMDKNNYMSSYKYNRDFRTAITKIYDITDKSSPILISELEQSGKRYTTLMIDNILYTVTNYSVTTDDKSCSVPMVKHNDETVSINAKNIACFENVKQSQYAVINMTDVTTGKLSASPTAVLGGSAIVNCTKEYMYISEFIDGEDCGGYPERENCPAMKLNLKNNKFDIAASDEIAKHTDNKINTGNPDSYSGTVYDIGEYRLGIESDVNTGNNELTLYDNNMNRLDNIVFNNIWLNTKTGSLSVNNEKSVYALPAGFSDDTGHYFGVVTFEIQNDKIVITNKFKSESYENYQFRECLFTDDYIYSIGINSDASDDKKITVNKYKY